MDGEARELALLIPSVIKPLILRMKVTLRKAEEGDIVALIELDEIAQIDGRRADLLRHSVNGERCIVAEVNGTPVGFIIVDRHFFGEYFVELLYVAERVRRHGVGTALISHVEAEHASTKLFTSTNLSNKAMQCMLEKRGWPLSGIVENLDEGDPELVYVKLPRGDAGVPGDGHECRSSSLPR